MELFHRYGLWGGMRIAHVMFAVMWMGLLWFFNFVQTPAYAEMEPAARNNAFDKLTWRALWWFRYAAMFTVASGLLVLLIGGFSKTDAYSSAYWKSPPGMGLAAAILFALIMLYNVLGVIWPNQQIVIANAQRAGRRRGRTRTRPPRRGPARWRRGRTRSSRSPCSCSWSARITSSTTSATSKIEPAAGARLLLHRGARDRRRDGSERARQDRRHRAGGTNVIYDTHQYAIYTAVGLMVFFYLFFEIFFRA